MSKFNIFRPTGFFLVGNIAPAGLRTILAADVSIKKGDVLHDDGNGEATNATTDFTKTTFLGVAAEDVDNSDADALSVQYIPPLPQHQFIVAVAENALITQTAVGLIVDMEAVNTLDISEAVTAGPGFRIDEIEAGTEAVAANAYGFAIGHFEQVYAT